MNRKKLDLINAINNYDESKLETFEELKNIVCEISDNKKYEEDIFLDKLLFLAAQKMRIFGYNSMNNFDINYQKKFMLTDFETIKTNIIEQTYTTKTKSLLDYEQMDILTTFNNLKEKKIFLSAPTSFGKTRLLREIIYENNFNNIVLIFPTNALLFENYTELLEFNRFHKLNYTFVNNTNISELKNEKHIFVLTPERFLKLKSEYPKIKIDFFFMDEVYKIDNFFIENEDDNEDDRDKIFRIALYILSKEVESFYLAGPYVNLENIGQGLQNFVNKNNIVLKQITNELVVKKNFNSWEKEVVHIDDKKIKMTKNKNTNTLKLISSLVDNDKGQILIYCETKNSVDTLANRVSESSKYKFKKENMNSSLEIFINHIENRYSFIDDGKKVNWGIKKYLENGISIHYGALPKYIQMEMLKLFNENITKIIISTTSITEGVNTNAKNLIFHGKNKGRKDLKIFDVKNVIGRAGRYYHHFVGNIYFLEEEIAEKNKQDKSEELDFITFSKKKISDVDIDNTDIADLVGENKNIKEERYNFIRESGIPKYIFEKNRTIDWKKQIELYKLINQKDTKDLQNFLTKIENLRKFINQKDKNLEQIFCELENVDIIEEYEQKILPAVAKTYSYKGFRGLLSYEIKSKREKKDVNLVTELSLSEYNTCYRSAFNKMSNIVEYRVPKYLSLYLTIFAYVCSERDIVVNSQKIDTIINYYELGVFSMIGNQLVGLGFPTVTIKLLEDKYIDEMNMEIELFKNDLRLNNLKCLMVLDTYEKKLLNRLVNNI